MQQSDPPPQPAAPSLLKLIYAGLCVIAVLVGICASLISLPESVEFVRNRLGMQAVNPAYNVAERAWKAVQHSTSVPVLWDFIREFGDTPQGALARERLEAFNPPPWPQISRIIAFDIIRMRACVTSWNLYVQAASRDSAVAPIAYPKGISAKLGETPGIKYGFETASLVDVSVCGWFFIPTGTSGLAQLAAKTQSDAIESNRDAFDYASQSVLDFIMLPDGSTQSGARVDPKLLTDAITQYERAVTAAAKTIDPTLTELSPAICDSMPITFPPNFSDRESLGAWWLFGGNNNKSWEVRSQVATTMRNYESVARPIVAGHKW
jgi:hypothetical protein